MKNRMILNKAKNSSGDNISQPIEPQAKSFFLNGGKKVSGIDGQLLLCLKVFV